MLKHTLILPDDEIAAVLLQGAIDDLDVVLMLIIGDDQRAAQLVSWADKLAGKYASGTLALRHVVWVRNPDRVADILARLFREPRPRVGVLNFHDTVREQLDDENGALRPIDLELAFLKGFEQ